MCVFVPFGVLLLEVTTDMHSGRDVFGYNMIQTYVHMVKTNIC